MALNISNTARKYLTNPIKSAFDTINSAVMTKDGCDNRTSSILSLISAVIWADGNVSESEIELYKSYLEPNYSKAQINKYTKILEVNNSVNIEETCAKLCDLKQDEKEELIKALITISSTGSNSGKLELAVIQKISSCLGLSETIHDMLLQSFKQEKELRDKVLKSGSGIFAALAIVILFALTATFLKSVLFGVILAYLFLPLQRLFEKKLLPSSISKSFIYCVTLPLKPFSFIAMKTNSLFKVKADTDKVKNTNDINRDLACHLTTITAVVLLVSTLCGISWLSAQKLSGLGESTRTWISSNTKTYNLETLKPKLEKIPGFASARDEISLYLNDKENQKKLALLFVGKSKGVIGTLLSILSSLSVVLLDALLSLFFFSFFLQKMASFESTSKNWNPGEYLIESIFSTNWMPKTTLATKSEAQNIINDIFKKLHIWIKGYASIIAIETIIYTTIFITLGLPYPIILGMIAGCTVLLPFVGPLVSGLLTILVYVAVTGTASNMTIIILILVTYCIMNAVIEQLMLYPALIGEALGLTTLETIIVVLLGGLFAGLPGMIFAVPVASILKLITPKIYGCWQT